MLQVGRLAPRTLGEAAATRIEAFLQGQFNDDGGGQDRSGDSDLYYTVFVLEGLTCLQAELPAQNATRYLEGFGAGPKLDLVHLACLARCWAALPRQALPPIADAMQQNFERFRTPDLGYANDPGARRGTVYHAFLALGAHQDLGCDLPDATSLAGSVMALRTKDGGFANTPQLSTGSVTATAAAITLLRQLQQPIPDEVGEWLLAQAHPQGGFPASPTAPMPDLLSTATALHALSGLQVDFEPIRERCLDFVDSLWTGEAFCGHWADDRPDSEYTFYGLLALGHLSL